MTEEFTTGLNTLGLIITALSFAFLIGYNWRRVNMLEQMFQDLAKTLVGEREDLNNTYVRKDIMTIQLGHLTARVDRMAEQMTYLTGQERDRQVARERREAEGTLR